MPNFPYSPELFPSSKRHHSNATTPDSPPDSPIVLSQELFPHNNAITPYSPPDSPIVLSQELFPRSKIMPVSISHSTPSLLSRKKRDEPHDRNKRQYTEMSQTEHALFPEPTSSSSQSEDSDPCFDATSSQEIYDNLLSLSQESPDSSGLTPPSFQPRESIITVKATPPSPQMQHRDISTAPSQTLLIQTSLYSVAHIDTLPKQTAYLPRESVKYQTDSKRNRLPPEINEEALTPILHLITLSRCPRRHPEEALGMLKNALMQYKAWIIKYLFHYSGHSAMVTRFAINFARVYLALNNIFFAQSHCHLISNSREALNDNEALLAEAIMYQGELLRQQGNLPNAMQKLEEALAIASALKPTSLCARIHLVLAKTYLDDKNFFSAHEEAQKAAAIFKQHKSVDDTHPWMKSTRELLASSAARDNLSTVRPSTHSFGNFKASSSLSQSVPLHDSAASKAKQLFRPSL